jgi:hypothetical protein
VGKEELMTLKELLKPQMKKERYRSSDLAHLLGKKPQSVSYALNRDINYITVRTLGQYVSAVGLKLDVAQLISNQ